jgi:Uma2 family endonuclease
MSTTAIVSVEEYLRYTEKPNCEYIEGVLYPKAMPTAFHGLLEFILVALLRRAGLDARPEVTVRLSATKYLVPDVIAAKHIQNPYPTEPPLLCVEILSPEDGVGAMLAKCEKYHTWGVPYCWVIDPMKRVAWEYQSGGEPVRIGGSGKLQAGEVTIDVEELFAQLKD